MLNASEGTKRMMWVLYDAKSVMVILSVKPPPTRRTDATDVVLNQHVAFNKRRDVAIRENLRSVFAAMRMRARKFSEKNPRKKGKRHFFQGKTRETRPNKNRLLPLAVWVVARVSFNGTVRRAVQLRS